MRVRIFANAVGSNLDYNANEFSARPYLRDKRVLNKLKIMAKNKEQEALYKAEGLNRMKIRKAVRKQQRILNKRYNHANATWYEDGVCRQNCEIGGSCEYPCNGDC